MAQTELKTIPVNQILANFSQPREKFDRATIKELAESILSNGLINPITVRKYKGNKYMIVSGERRWQAYKFAGLKNIQAFVKEYENDGQIAIESLIENVHREDLKPIERAKYLKKIADIEKIYHIENKIIKSTFGKQHHIKKGDININQLAKRVSMNADIVRGDLSLLGFESGQVEEIPRKSLVRIATIKNEKDKKRILNLAKNKTYEDITKIVSITKKANDKFKEAIFKDEISIEQAESLSKIHSEKAREKALEQVKQHKHIADITPKLMERAKPELTDAVKRQFDTTQRRIFTYLNDAKTSLSKVNNNLKQANMMLSQLMNKSFEYGLDKRTLITIMQQMKSISDRLNEFQIENDRFNELKETFLERVEDRLEELK